MKFPERLIAACVGATLWASISAQSSFAQTSTTLPSSNSKAGDAALAQELTNPVAPIVQFPVQFNWNGRLGTENQGQWVRLELQPVIPIKVNDDWNIISRTVAPVIWQNDRYPGTGSQFGVGNVEQTFFLSPSKRMDGFVVGVGPVFYLPTTTDKLLGNSQTGAGPSAVVHYSTGPWSIGILTNQVWAFAGPVSYGAKPVNQTYLQPFVAYTTQNAWTFMLNSQSTYEWSTDKWTMPFNFLVSKLVHIDKTPVNIGLGVRYYAAAPNDGPKGFGARLQLTFLLPE